MKHKAGFVNIIGKPNVGKSTLLNVLMGQKLAIVTPKAQTTRHRLLAIYNDEDYQIVFSDTPGLMKPSYKLHNVMLKSIETAFEDADILILMVDDEDNPAHFADHPAFQRVMQRIKKIEVPFLFLINKIDRLKKEKREQLKSQWSTTIEQLITTQAPHKILPISAIQAIHIKQVRSFIQEHLPECPPYFPKDQLADRPERFFAAELIREKVFEQYRQEIPYSTEVAVTKFKDQPDLLQIDVNIIVNKKTQKPIVIGKGGKSIKKLGISARKELEDFFEKQVYLNLYVKVHKDWRDNPGKLRNFGYRF